MGGCGGVGKPNRMPKEDCESEWWLNRHKALPDPIPNVVSS